jgi:Rrf2 family iron-sulfur cluster assembly transcriptional regulator
MRIARDTPIFDIVTAAEEEMKMTRCEAESHQGCTASKELCLTHDLWEGLSEHIHEYFNAISLEDVCKKKILRTKQVPG